MIDTNELEREISDLLNRSPTYSTLEKLSVLYTVRDALGDDKPPANSYSFASEPSSEFLSAAMAATPDKLLSVMEEHMDALRVVYPREYDAVVRKLRE